MQIQCGSCGKQMNLPNSVAGKSVRCSCGQTLQVPRAQSAVPTTQPISPPTQTATSRSTGLESYWWLMTYIKINRILGYTFAVLLVVGAFLIVLGNVGMLTLLSELPVGEFFVGLLTMILSFVAYVLVGFVYLVIWFASADFLRAVVEIAENTRRIK